MNKFVYHFIIFLCLFVISSLYSYSSTELHIKLNKQQFIELKESKLWRQVSIQSSSLKLEQLISLYQNAPIVETTIASSGAFVSQINISYENIKQQTWFVNVYTNYLDVGVAIWQPKEGTPVYLEMFGQMASAAPKLSHSQAFSLPLNGSEAGTLWLYIEAKKFATPAIVTLLNKSHFYKTQFITNTISVMAITTMLILALIALFIYLRTGHSVTLACSGYIGLHGLGWLAAAGVFGHLFTFEDINPVYAGILIFPFAIAAASQFTKLLFDCQTEYIKLARFLNRLAWLSLLLGLTMPLLPFDISYLISHLIAMIWVPVSITVGLYMLGKKDFRAKYYFTGNLVYGLSLAIFVLSHGKHVELSFSPELMVLVALSIDCICILLSLSKWLEIQQKEYHRSYTISRVDPLTKVGNRYAQNEALASLTKAYCIVFIDFDGFKAINDNFGHEKGDEFLLASAKIMQQKLQQHGRVFRSGGDEFVWLAEIDNTELVAELLSQLSQLILDTEEQLKLAGWQDFGLSFGIATSLETQNQSECLSLADKRMYKHKQSKKCA